MKQSFKKLMLLLAATVAILLQTPVQAQDFDPHLRDDMLAKHYEPGGKYHMFGDARGSVKNRVYSVHTITDTAGTPLMPIVHERSIFKGVIGFETHFSGHGHEEHAPFDNHSSQSESKSSGNVWDGFTKYTLHRTGSRIHPADGYDGPQGGGFPAPKGARDIYSYYVEGQSTKTKLNIVPRAPFSERWTQENGNALSDSGQRAEEAGRLILENDPNKNWWGNGMDKIRGVLQGAVNPFITGFQGLGIGTVTDSITNPTAEYAARQTIQKLGNLSQDAQLAAVSTMQDSAFAVRNGVNDIKQWAVAHPNAAATAQTAGSVAEAVTFGRAAKINPAKWFDNSVTSQGKDLRGSGPRPMSTMDGEMAGGNKPLKSTQAIEKSTGRTMPNNLKEQLAMEEVRANPQGTTPARIPPMSDTKNGWLADDGWVKRVQNVNKVEIHYIENIKTGEKTDFKFKD